MDRSTAWRSRAVVACVAILAALLLAVPGARAATRTWTGTSSPSWMDTGNWSGGAAPVAGDDLVFPDGTANTANVNDFPAGTSFTSITVTGAHQLTGNAITLTGATPLAFSTPAPATITFNPSVTFTNATATITAIQPADIAVYVNLGVITIGGGSLTVHVEGNLAQAFFTQAIGETSSAALVKTGTGEALLTTDNTYSGITRVNGGYIGVGANGALGAGTNIAANGTVVNSGGTLYLYNGAQVANERVVLNGAGQSGNGSFQTRSGSGPVGWGGDFVLADNGLSLNSLASSLAISGKITGSGSFRFGRSPATITNAGNDYAGGTVVGQPSGASLLVLGADEVIPNGSFVQILGGATGTLDLNGRTETIGSLSGSGNLSVNGGTLFTGNDNTAQTFFGTITGSGSITKVGTGTWTISGSSPGYTGSLAVTAGTVLVNGTLGGSVSVANAVLGGTGSVGAISTSAGGNGTVSPGVSPGVLTATSLALASGNTLAIELNGTTAGTQYDQLRAGSVTLGGTLAVSLGFAPVVGNTFVIVDNIGSNPVSGVFGGLPEGTVFTVGGTPLQISYVGGTGNDVTLTVVSAVPTLTVTTSSLPGGTVGTPYVATLAASGGVPPYTWSLASGALPPGVTLNPATGALSGTPTTPGTYAFTVAVTDSEVDARVIAPKATAVAPLSIVITAAVPTQPIPALGPWTLALLALLTALGGVLATRRRDRA